MPTIFAETVEFASKADAYKLLIASKGETGDATTDALVYLGERAARDAMMFLGRFHGAAWLKTNKTYRVDEWMRAVGVIERGIGRNLGWLERSLVRHSMMPVFNGK